MFFADWQKTSCCNIVKYSSLLCFGTFSSSLSRYFDSAGMITPPRGGNRPQRKYESLDEYLDGFRHTGGKRPLCNFRIVVGGSYFPKADGCCSAHGLSHHCLPLFPFLCEVLKFEGSLGKFVWRWEFTYLCKKINVYGKYLGVVNSRLREILPK